MKLTLTGIMWGFVLLCSLYSQPSIDHRKILTALEAKVQDGDMQSLRDIGSLLDHPKVKTEAIQILSDHTLFSPEEIKLHSNLSKSDFLNFYYTHEDEFKYSDLLDVFYLSPLEKWKTSYKIKAIKDSKQDPKILLRSYKTAIQKALDTSNSATLSSQMKLIDQLKEKEGYQFLLNLLQDKAFSNFSNKEKLYQECSSYLQNYPTINTVKAILQLVKQKEIKAQTAAPILANLTNIFVVEDRQFDLMVPRYQHYIDSLNTIKAMQLYGYESFFDFKATYFNYPVDYFGRLLSLSEDYPWIQHNALQNLKESEHPRALYYIASQLYKYRKRNGQKKLVRLEQYTNLIKELTQLEIGVQDENNKITFDIAKAVSNQTKLNYLIYWASHYTDYSWNENYKLFINKNEAVEKTENYERYFRRLNSTNDSVAFQSYKYLTEGEAVEVIQLSKKYRQLLRSYNKYLPPFKYQYLEQLVLLTSFCKTNGIDYYGDDQLQQFLHELSQTTDHSKRYLLENKLIESLTADKITAIEYWACLHTRNKNNSFSAGRVLDHFYSKNWMNILSDEEQLRLYLKKSLLFENIGVFGICNSYLNKFNVENQDLQNRFQDLLKTEVDPDIVSQITRLTGKQTTENGLSLQSFLENPAGFNRRDIKILPPPENERQYELVIQGILKEKSNEAIKNLFAYLRVHPHLDAVPYLFELIDDKRLLIQREDLRLTIADYSIPVLEQIYEHSFPSMDEKHPFNTEKWRTLWKNDGRNYKDWVKFFFEKKLIALEKSPALVIDDINKITASPNFLPAYKDVVLKALKKVEPQKNIRRLSMNPKLSVKNDLSYFEDFDFSYKELDDIPKLFSIDDPEKMLDYLDRKSTGFDLTDRGSFYNNLFRSRWLMNYVNSGKISAQHIEKIKNILNTYLNESDFLSEFEEQATNLHIALLDNINRTLEERLIASSQLDLDEGSKLKIQESIISTISYKEIATIVSHFDELIEQKGKSKIAFLQTDFGLPIFELDDDKAYEKFLNNHKKMSEVNFYTHYLKEFGVDFQDKRGQLDFYKIYSILKYDIVSPFSGEGGRKRDYFVYGIIKLLELHFNDRLGFHEKMNESQTFFSYSSSKRAHAWMEYLEKNNIVNIQKIGTPSFNQNKVSY